MNVDSLRKCVEPTKFQGNIALRKLRKLEEGIGKRKDNHEKKKRQSENQLKRKRDSRDMARMLKMHKLLTQ